MYGIHSLLSQETSDEWVGGIIDHKECDAITGTKLFDFIIIFLLVLSSDLYTMICSICCHYEPNILLVLLSFEKYIIHCDKNERR